MEIGQRWQRVMAAAPNAAHAATWELTKAGHRRIDDRPGGGSGTRAQTPDHGCGCFGRLGLVGHVTSSLPHDRVERIGVGHHCVDAAMEWLG